MFTIISVNHAYVVPKSIEKQIASVFGKTLGIILVLIMAFVIYGSLFAPRMMSNLTTSLGMQNASLYYSKVQYSRDKNINSLYIVINKSIELNSYKNTEKYLAKLFLLNFQIQENLFFQ